MRHFAFAPALRDGVRALDSGGLRPRRQGGRVHRRRAQQAPRGGGQGQGLQGFERSCRRRAPGRGRGAVEGARRDGHGAHQGPGDHHHGARAARVAPARLHASGPLQTGVLATARGGAYRPCSCALRAPTPATCAPASWRGAARRSGDGRVPTASAQPSSRHAPSTPLSGASRALSGGPGGSGSSGGSRAALWRLSDFELTSAADRAQEMTRKLDEEERLREEAEEVAGEKLFEIDALKCVRRPPLLLRCACAASPARAPTRLARLLRPPRERRVSRRACHATQPRCAPR